MSPVGAHGGNCAIESAAALANSWYEEVLQDESSGLNGRSIERALSKYYELRIDRARLFYNAVHFAARLGSRDGFGKSLLTRYVLPRMDITRSLFPLIENAEKINFFPEPARAKGFKTQAERGISTQSSQTQTNIAKGFKEAAALVRKLVYDNFVYWMQVILIAKRRLSWYSS